MDNATPDGENGGNRDKDGGNDHVSFDNVIEILSGALQQLIKQ